MCATNAPETSIPTFRRYCGRLIGRAVLFLLVLAAFIWRREWLDFTEMTTVGGSWLVRLLWVWLLLSTILMFFPRRSESMGMRKQYRRYFMAGGTPVRDAAMVRYRQRENRRAYKVALIWLLFNAIFWLLYATGVIAQSFLVLLAVFYYLCDMICILLFCPFQRWLMKNRCCVTCRIFQWDMAMVCTPLIVVPSLFSWSLSLLAVALLVRWEWTYRHHTSRFLETYNANLRCCHCREQLCCLKGKSRLEPLADRET